MLTLLFLAAYIRRLSASPLADSSAGQTSVFIDYLVPRNGTDTSTSGSAGGDDDNTRTTSDIVTSCFGTIVACLWSAAHPNIDGPDDAGWTCFKRRVLNMVYAFIAPELITLWAMRQYVAAKFITQDYNENVAKAQPRKSTIKGMVKEYFGRVPEAAVERKEVEPWTQTHAFFVQMGGFMLYDRQGRPKRVLTYDDLRHLIVTNKIDPPGLNEKELADRNKSDWLSKAVAVSQTTWFVVQCITRRVENLPLTTLEVMTLAFAVLNAIVYWVWWDKPQGLGMGVCVMLKEDEDVPPRKSTDKSPSPALATAEAAHSSDVIEMERLIDSETKPVDCSSFDTVPEIMSEPAPTPTPVRHSFFRRKLLKDREEFPWLVFVLLRIPFRFGQTILRPVSKIIGDAPPTTLPNCTMRVPMFYSDVRGEGTAPWTVSCLIGIVFGALHLLAWGSPFPSWLERTYWRIFAAISVALPALILVGTFLQPYTEEEDEEAEGGNSEARQSRSRVHKLGVKAATGVFTVFGMIIGLSTFSYMFGRFALLALALLALRDPAPRTLADIKWPSFIPHLF